MHQFFSTDALEGRHGGHVLARKLCLQADQHIAPAQQRLSQAEQLAALALDEVALDSALGEFLADHHAKACLGSAVGAHIQHEVTTTPDRPQSKNG
ncbi:UNVERIFIED_CONTAM: hypothetical protein LK11_71510 [Mumia flava]